MSIIEKLKVAAAELEHIKLSPDESMWIVSHVRTQDNTLASTQAELELCRATVGEANKRIAELEAQANTSFYNAHNFAAIKSQRNEVQERLADCANALAAERAAHLATRRALLACYDDSVYLPEAAISRQVEAARAEVAQADADAVKHHENCDALDWNPEGIVKPCNCGANKPKPRADAQKGGSA